MSDVYTYDRGQIWYWEDPLYGKKARGEMTYKGEMGLRYSRYVLIVQNVRGMNASSIMVAPLSTASNGVGDVEILVRGGDKISLVKLNRLMPILPIHLTKYIGTLYPDVMEKIDLELSNLYLPHETPTKQKDVMYTSNVSSVEIPKDVNEQDKIETPIDLTEEIKLDIIESNAPNEMMNLPKEEEKSQVIEKVEKEEPTKKEILWDDDRKRSFVRCYRDNGKLSAAAEFRLERKTAYNYWSKWKDSFQEAPVESKDEEPIDTRIDPVSDKIGFLQYTKTHKLDEVMRKYKIRNKKAIHNYRARWKNLSKESGRSAGNKKWSTESKLKFLEFAQEHGLKKASIEYSIEEISAYKYFVKFRMEFPDRNFVCQRAM